MDDSAHRFISEADRDTLVRIASQHSRQRDSLSPRDEDPDSADTLVANQEDDPATNPLSKEFDMQKWLRKVIWDLDQQGIKGKRSGVMFKNLQVSGKGSALQYQETVVSSFTSVFRLGQYLRGNQKRPRQILKNFNGILESGELLVVLGRPGSGCSTFLKSLCGELNGLILDPESVINYNGNNLNTFNYHLSRYSY